MTIMAFKTKKTNTEAKTTDQNQDQKNHQIIVTRVNQLDNGVIMFDAKVNSVTIYGCSYRVLQRKDGSGEFGKVGFPSKKGSDGKWYNEAYFFITEDDLESIEKQLEEKLG